MKTIAIFLSFALLVAGCTSGSSFVKPGYDFSKINKTAVVKVTGAANNVAVQNEVSDLFAMELLKRGFDVVERSQVDAVLNEQDFQATDFTSSQGVAKLGEILNVDAVVVVNVPNLSESISMTAKMIDVETASILWIGEGSGRVGSGLGTATGAIIGAAAGAAIGHQVESNGTGALVGGAAGAIAGGAAGHSVDPTVAGTLRTVVQKVSAEMPSKL